MVLKFSKTLTTLILNNMKTLKDFKGTQGEFTVNGRFIYIGAIDISECERNHNTMSFEEVCANAKLFANSKKVLEAAIWAHNELSTAIGLTEWNPKIEKIMRDNLAKLEEAINNSL